MEKPTGSAPAGAKDQVEKQARQLAYDVRYKVRGALKAQSGGKSDPATVRKAYLTQLGKSPVKARAKSMLIGEDYINSKELATESAVSALYRVFVEGIHEEEVKEESGDKTYKVRVTDKKSGNSYVRMASRAKISELRNNPNISSVEMTGYGEPTKSEKYKGKQTAAVKAGKDYDGDGKVESPTAEYKGSKDKAIKKAMKESWKEGFSELIEKKKDEDKKITGKGVNNKKLIKIFPVDEKVTLNGRDPDDDSVVNVGAKDDDKGLAAKEKKANQIKKQVLLKKLQAVRQGGGADITASYKPELELTEEFITEKVYHATEYFFNEGINEDGLDLIVEEVGIDEFTAFVIDGPQELNEDEAAYQKAKKKAITGSNRREREGKGEYSPKGSTSPYSKQGLGAKTKKKPKLGHTGTKVVDATQKAKETQSSKPASKEGIGSKIRGFVKKGVERHNKARAAGKVPEKRAKEFGKGVVSGVKTAVKAAKDVKKAVVGEDAEYGYDKEGNSLNPKDKKKKEEEDPRSMGTKYRLIKNKLRAMGLKMSHELEGRVIDEEGSHGEKVDGKFMSYATMKSKGIKPKRTAVQNVINNTIRPAQGKPKGQNKSDYANRHSAQNRPESPKSTVTKGREQKARADAAMRDTRGT